MGEALAHSPPRLSYLSSQSCPSLLQALMPNKYLSPPILSQVLQGKTFLSYFSAAFITASTVTTNDVTCSSLKYEFKKQDLIK